MTQSQTTPVMILVAIMLPPGASQCLNNNGGCDTLTDCSDIEGQFECGPCPNGYTDRRSEVGYAGDSLLSVCRNVNE